MASHVVAGKVFKAVADSNISRNGTANTIKNAAKAENFLTKPGEVDKFAKQIINLNKNTEGFGTIINSHPSSILNTASYYKTPIDQASSIFKGLIKNHIFIDGNKRTAVNVLKSFFTKNNMILKVSDKELVNLALKIEKNIIKDVSQISKILK